MTLNDYLLNYVKDKEQYLKNRKKILANKLITAKNEEYSEIHLNLKVIEEQLNLLNNYTNVSQNKFICPECWILNKSDEILRPIPGDNIHDYFKCDNDHEYKVEFRKNIS
jgi:hypothetical protein